MDNLIFETVPVDSEIVESWKKSKRKFAEPIINNWLAKHKNSKVGIVE
ncbi:MAG: hypothetical protein JXL97_05875 [Bacteroidales bacterium]|nr:hypothetical protein [Bacteroidales bacterium]